MKVWVTRYALTSGIEATEATLVGPKMIQVKNSGRFEIYYHKPDWYDNLEEAIDQAKRMRERKIKSLEKAIEKMKTLKF